MKKNRLLLSIFLALTLIVFILSVYAPGLIYFSQIDSFKGSFIGLVYKNAFLCMVVICLITFACSFFTAKKLIYFASLTFVAAVLIYLQADVFNASYGVLDGSELNFSQYDTRGIMELLCVVVSLVLAVVFRRWFASNSLFVVSIMLLFLIGNMTYQSLSHSKKEMIEDEVIDDEFNQYSSDKNLIIIVLDGFGAEYFQMVLDQNASIVDDYKGFVNYTDAISNYSATVGSIPSMLTGKMYPKNVKYKTFIGGEVANNGMPKLFEQMGYVVSFISASMNFSNIYPSRFLFNVTADSKAYKNYSSLQLTDYALFRLAPHFFKKHIYNDGLWLFSKRAAEKTMIPNTFSERGKAFMDYVTEHAVVAEDVNPRFKFIHATIPHPDYVYDAQCERFKYTKKFKADEKMIAHSKCALLLLSRLLNKYKSLGVYDNSVIVVTSDHGARVYNNPSRVGFPSDFELSASGIMFMIKGMGVDSPFKQVDQPFSLLKLKDALVDESLHSSDYSEMKDEKRKFYAYKPVHKAVKGYLSDAPLYEVSADYTNPDSWELLEYRTNNCQKQVLPFEMLFGHSDRSGYCGAFGFKQIGKSYNAIWTQNDDNRIIFELENTEEIKPNTKISMSLILTPSDGVIAGGTALHIAVNGNEIGRTKFNKDVIQTIQFEFDSSILLKDQNQIQLLLPNVMSGKELGINRKRAKLGVYLEKISFNFH